eukprot:gene5626-6200_t
MTKVKSLAETNSCQFIEWIEYHFLLGVNKIFVNDDCSEEPLFKQILHYYSVLGQVVIASEQSNCTNHIPDEGGLMKRTFQNYGHRCEWMAVIDMDEYITFVNENVEVTFSERLKQANTSIIRMPWFVMGSEGHEKRPKGVTIESFIHGAMDQHHHCKTIARSEEVDEWPFQHVPRVKRPHEMMLGMNMTRKEYFHSPRLHKDEVTVGKDTANGNAIIVPRSDIYLKHFIFLSWEQYKQQRGAYKKIASGVSNLVWGVNPREKWLIGNQTYFTNTLSGGFTNFMANKLKLRLHERHLPATVGSIGKESGEVQQSKSSVFDVCAKYWW